MSFKFKEGDYVECTYWGVVYSTFHRFVKERDLPTNPDEHYHLDEGDRGVVLGKGIHPNTGVEVYALRLDNGRVGIAGGKGLTLINEKLNLIEQHYVI